MSFSTVIQPSPFLIGGCWHLCGWSFLDRTARSQYRAGTEHCSLRSFLRDWTSRPSPKVRNKNALVLKTRWLRPARFLVNQDSFSKLCSNGERQSSPLHALIIRCIFSMKGLRSHRGIGGVIPHASSRILFVLVLPTSLGRATSYIGIPFR